MQSEATRAYRGSDGDLASEHFIGGASKRLSPRRRYADESVRKRVCRKVCFVGPLVHERTVL
jgi:hypothetical protein